MGCVSQLGTNNEKQKGRTMTNIQVTNDWVPTFAGKKFIVFGEDGQLGCFVYPAFPVGGMEDPTYLAKVEVGGETERAHGRTIFATWWASQEKVDLCVGRMKVGSVKCCPAEVWCGMGD
jgi:hypothetical protein